MFARNLSLKRILLIGVIVQIAFIFASYSQLVINAAGDAGCDRLVTANGGGGFTSIQAGIDAMQPGQTLCVRGGSYPEKVVLKDKSNLVIQSYPGELAVIDGRNHDLPDPNCKQKDGKTGTGHGGRAEGRDPCYNDPLVLIQDSSNLSLINFEIKGSSGAGLVVVDAHDILLRGINSHGHWSMGIVTSTSSGTTERITIEDSRMWDNIRARPEKNLVGGSGGLFGTRVKDSVMRNSYVYNNFGEGFDVGRHAENILVTNSWFWDNSHTNFYINDGKNVTFDSNFIFCSDDRPNWHARHGIMGKDSYGTGMTMRNENNSDNAQNRSPGYGNRMTNNIVVGCSTNLVIASQKGKLVRDSVIAHNTLINARGIEGSKDKTVSNLNITNGKYSNIVIANNLIIQEDTRYPALVMQKSWLRQLPTKSFTVANNMVNHHTGRQYPSGFIVVNNLALAEPYTSILPGSADPRLFQLAAGSPAIDAAALLAEIGQVRRDFFGFSRGARPDIGAHEWAGPPPPTPSPTKTPTGTPTTGPTNTPTADPTSTPTATPTAVPSGTSTNTPTAVPTDEPTTTPADTPTAIPTDEPTATPTDTPTADPTSTPTHTPTADPTEEPTATPTPSP